MNLDLTRALIERVLQTASLTDWSIQGFGMARTYLDNEKRYRLNIWHSSLAIPDVSTLHTHPWNFTSWIIAGQLTNIKFIEGMGSNANPYDSMVIKTGPGGGPSGEVEPTWLTAYTREFYLPGTSYVQDFREIHRTEYLDGTITINDRTRVGDGEHARVFWPSGSEWVDAQPRLAQPSDLELAINTALEALV